MNGTQLVKLRELQTDANAREAMYGVQAHDRRALEKLYLIYYGPLARLLFRVVAQANAVDEIISDTFMTIWTCAKELPPEARVAVWVFGIAYQTALQSMNSNGARGSCSFAEVFGRQSADVKSKRPGVDRLEHRLNRLPLEEHLTVALAYQMGFSLEDIAQITRVAPATVETRMTQVRRILQSIG